MPKQGQRPIVARTQREKLAPDVPELTLTLPPNAPAGTLVKRDGQVMAAAALGVGLPVDPGEYGVTTQAPDGPVWEQRITVGKGEKKKVMLEVKTAPPVVQAPPPPKVEVPPPLQEPPAPQNMSGRRKAAFAIGGVGIAGLALGGVMGGLTAGKKSVIGEHCGAAIMAPDTRCDPTGLDAAHSSKMLGLGSTIGVIAGIAGIGTGAVLLATERKVPSPKTSAGRRWISAEVLSIGPAGTMLGARGAW